MFCVDFFVPPTDIFWIRFWSKVDIRNSEECWNWLGSKHLEYGRLKYHNQHYRSHRVSWTYFYGRIPTGLCVLHHCDNRTCVNPGHLFLGTIIDNIADMVRKGRNARGRKTTWDRQKLTPKEVRLIRESPQRNCELAVKYAVDPSVVSRVRRNKIYNWVENG